MRKISTCHNCGTQMVADSLREYLVTKFDGGAVMCADVPIARCPMCGEVLFAAEVAELFDKIRRGLVTPTESVTVQLPKVRVEDLLAPA